MWKGYLRPKGIHGASMKNILTTETMEVRGGTWRHVETHGDLHGRFYGRIHDVSVEIPLRSTDLKGLRRSITLHGDYMDECPWDLNSPVY